VIRWGAAGLFGVVLLPVVAGVALSGGSGGCGTAGGGTFVGAPGAAVITGRVSTFGPPGEPAHSTALAGHSDSEPGISLHIPGTHYADARNEQLMGHMFHVQVGRFSADLPDIDVGPADYLSRSIDVTGAGARQLGINPSAFPTDSVGTATEIAGTASTVDVSLPLTPAPACAAPVGTVTPGTTATILPDGTASIPANAPPAVAAAIAAGNEIHTMPYSIPEGSGAQHYGPLSTRWPAYDCSGATSYVLWRAGLHTVTADVSGSLESWGAPGPGRWITVYANPSHTWVVVAGIAFDTSHYSPAVPAGPGPRWQSNPTGNLRDGLSYVQRHPAGL
jgi:hypothetical protein